ncbi:hypothetical protein B0H11DRAFT_2114890 [Mycena galericulata]|nr:hypothetical protein B0H11DRAFT_2114890 [Mycena galericulata]
MRRVVNYRLRASAGHQTSVVLWLSIFTPQIRTSLVWLLECEALSDWMDAVSCQPQTSKSGGRFQTTIPRTGARPCRRLLACL